MKQRDLWNTLLFFQSNHRVKAMELPRNLTAFTRWFDAHHFMI